jgi:hypothetical protein
VKPVALYAIGRILFGIASFAAPAVTGRTLAGPGGASPDAQAFLTGMGGREIGLGLGLLASIRADGPVRALVVAGLLADCSDLAGIGRAWTHMPPAKRWLGLTTAGAAAAAGTGVLAVLQRRGVAATRCCCDPVLPRPGVAATMIGAE